MRAAVIFGLDSSEKDLKPFQQKSRADWVIGLPASSSEADAILIFGGDGTVHRHLPRLAQLQLPVLIVPCGSGNDFARALKLGNRKNSLAAWCKFSSGGKNVRSIDLGVITPLPMVEAAVPRRHYFCCVGGVGLDGEVARRANQLPRWLRGHGGYVLSLPSALVKFDLFRVKLSLASAENPEMLVPRGESPIVLAAFANAPVYGGGMKIAPQAQMDDGLLDVCIVARINKFKLFCLFPTVYFGRHLGREEVEYLQTTRLRVETERALEVYADGEYVCKTPIEVSLARNALRVIV
ncbi:MAG TPA: diacylglycerol kinase family protein [Terriglobales bacterium]|nr:diacylglycerol kinase family protein [Terriglobales bacterium]